MKNELVCWKENSINRWEMIKERDSKSFLLNLIQNNDVDKHSIFIIPTNGFVSGIWLFPQTHKSNRVDFWNFYDDFGTVYEKPILDEKSQKIIDKINKKNKDDTKYGWISPEGKYYHCGYQGHINLADRICFGMVDVDNSEKYLEETGWCKIYKPLGDNQYSVYVGGKHVITDKQMKTLTKMNLENAKDISKMLCKDTD